MNIALSMSVKIVVHYFVEIFWYSPNLSFIFLKCTIMDGESSLIVLFNPSNGSNKVIFNHLNMLETLKCVVTV